MEETKSMLSLFSEPIVERCTNCVSLATLDPFAVPFRRALSRKHVVPVIKKTRGVRKARDRDIAIWWDDMEDPEGSYHFALIMGDYYLMKSWKDTLIQKLGIKESHDRICSQFDHHKVVRRFRLPLVGIKKKNADILYKMWQKGYWDVILKIFNEFEEQVLNKEKTAT